MEMTLVIGKTPQQVPCIQLPRSSSRFDLKYRELSAVTKHHHLIHIKTNIHQIAYAIPNC